MKKQNKNQESYHYKSKENNKKVSQVARKSDDGRLGCVLL